MSTSFDNIFQSEKKAMLQLLEQAINIDSPPHHIAGVTTVCKVFEQFLDAHQIAHRRIPMKTVGPILIAEINPTSTQQPVILIGHMDTVFPEGTAAENPFRIDSDQNIHGPGNVDMKSGDIIGLFVLKQLAQDSHFTRPVKLILVSDEENLHSYSNAKEVIIKESKGACYALNLESGYPDEGIVVGRKGGAIIDIEIAGIAAHSGHHPTDGSSAILEMAHKIIALEDLNDYNRGKLVNCGKVTGGTAENIIPDHAKINVAIRFPTVAIRDELLREIQTIVAETNIAHTHTTMTTRITIDCMETTPEVEKLFTALQQCAETINYPAIHPIQVGGASDSGILVTNGIPTLCALGGRGSGPHTPEEQTEVRSLTERATLLTAFIRSEKAVETLKSK